MEGVLLKVIAGFYYVEAGSNVYICKAKGIFRKDKQTPLAGDRVEINTGKLTLEKILSRKNSLVRPPVANVDKLFIISSHNTPAPNTLAIDTLCIIAEENSIEPVIIFNKADLGSLDGFRDIYAGAGYSCIVASAKTGGNCELIKPLISGISVFTGNSGVGKSSLLNAVFPDFSLKTGEISEKLGRGKHTTREVELFKVGNAYIADTPGFSSMTAERVINSSKDKLDYLFIEFRNYLGKCKFKSCVHIGEKGCAVKEAVDNGSVAVSRYQNYRTLFQEIKDRKEWEK